MNALEFKTIRVLNKLSQKEFAELLGIAHRAVQYYEAGEREVPLKVELEIERNPKIKKKHEAAHEVKKYTFSTDNIMDVPLVNQYAYAGYLAGYGDIDYIEHLPRMPWVIDRERKGNYMCFEMKGDSMNDGSHESYLPGDILLGREVRKDYWRSKLHIDKWDFIIVTPGEGILFKRIIKHDVEKGIITLHSLNDEYEDFEMYLKDISQIFNVVDIKRNVQRR